MKWCPPVLPVLGRERQEVFGSLRLSSAMVQDPVGLLETFPEKGKGALGLHWSLDSFVFALFFSFSNLEMGIFFFCIVVMNESK